MAAANIFAIALSGGCVYLPQTTTVYDSECGIYKRRMTLEVHQVGVFLGCSGETCATALVVAGAVSATTAVVSGSVVVAGNVVYWLEKQGRCMGAVKKPETALPPPIQ